MLKNSFMVILFFIGHFYNFFCKFFDGYFQITSYIKHKKHKKGTENNKPFWAHWQNLTNVSNFTILASFIDLFIFETECFNYIWNVFYSPFFPHPLPREYLLLQILVYVFVSFMCSHTTHMYSLLVCVILFLILSICFSR